MKKYIAFALCLCLIVSVSLVNVTAREQYGNVYCKSPKSSKRVALTFDDGPHPRYTDVILNILKEYGVTATFFVIGVNVENYLDAFKKICDSGCEIGNHTYSHKRIGNMSDSEIENEILKCEDVLQKAMGKRTQLFRPPQGCTPEGLSKITCRLGYNVVLWSIDTLDWSLNPSDNICSVITSEINGGDIILMHDYVSGGNTTCDALRKIIPMLLAEGYEFVTVSQLLE